MFEMKNEAIFSHRHGDMVVKSSWDLSRLLSTPENFGCLTVISCMLCLKGGSYVLQKLSAI